MIHVMDFDMPSIKILIADPPMLKSITGRLPMRSESIPHGIPLIEKKDMSFKLSVHDLAVYA